MKADTKINYIFILIFLVGLVAGGIIFSGEAHQIPNQLVLKVQSIHNDHDVILKDIKGNVYVMSVENAFDKAFIPGTVIYFGRNEVIIR
jgi:hypothetical protein